MTTGRTIYALINRKMAKIEEPKDPEARNFVIVCEYGDWSGYRTLDKCIEQFPELESKNRGNFFYRVVEA